MIKVENIDVYGWEAAIRGMRNPLNSWKLSDSHWCNEDCLHVMNDTEPGKECNNGEYKYCIGQKDLDLMKRLFKAGTEHRKYLRMINVTMDITCSLYWWKEFDTYKIGTACNSCSTMHKIQAKEFTLDDFSHEQLDYTSKCTLKDIIRTLNKNRELFNNTKDKQYWWNMIQLLPSSYNQRRTVQLSYETVFNIIRQREYHKVDDWTTFTDILKDLPYVKELIE